MADQFYDPKMECADRETMRALQSKRLVTMVEHCYNHVPLYKKRFDEMGLQPGDIRSIDDVTKLPFTYKTDLRDNYPWGCIMVRKSWVQLQSRCLQGTRRARLRFCRTTVQTSFAVHRRMRCI